MKFKQRQLFMLILAMVIFMIVSQIFVGDYADEIFNPAVVATDMAYKKCLLERANSEKVVILALVDQGFVDFAINFWEVSIKPLGIDNMLFVSLSKKACDELSLLDIPCYVYEDFSGGEDDSSYMSPVFLKKMNTRTRFILDALSWNFTILNTDTDVIFFKNPLDYFKCPECDLEILEDGIKNLLNAGFVFLRPTHMTVEVYLRMAAIAKNYPGSEDQAMLNKVITYDLRGKIKYNRLNSNQFMCGKKYYEDAGRYFADTAISCDTCIVVHNNWIVGKAAKIYRQKEMLQWVYDGGQYYSDPYRKYLIYENSVSFDDTFYDTFYGIFYGISKSVEEDKQALINAFAIGRILNRTVILPRLHCKSRFCPWNSNFYISHIDNSFSCKYRESVFLMHPKVPQKVKADVSPTFLIKSTKYANVKIGNEVSIKEPKSPTEGATSEEIHKWFGNQGEAVLKFHSLYGAFKGFSDKKEIDVFHAQLKDAFKKAEYRQY